MGAGAGVDVGVEVRVEEEEEAGRGAGAMGSNLRLLSFSTSGGGVVRRAVAEPVAMSECLRFSTRRVFAALRRSTSAFPVAAA